MTQFKEKAGKDKIGLVLVYILSSFNGSDILLYDSTHVPVGGIKQHLELSRDIAKI